MFLPAKILNERVGTSDIARESHMILAIIMDHSYRFKVLKSQITNIFSPYT